MVVEVDHELAVPEPSRSLRGAGRRPAQRGLHAGEELRERQRLRDVVVRPELEAADLVRLRAAGRDHEDRHAAELAEALEELPAIEAGQRDVQDDQVGPLVVEPAQGVGSGPGGDRSVAGLPDPQLDERRELGLVLDDEDGLSHRRVLGVGASGSVKRTRVPGRPSGRSPTVSRPPCASTSRRQMNSPRPVPGIRDSRTFQARWNGSVTSPRSASGTPTPSSSTVTASHAPVDRRPDHDRAAVRART